MLAIDMVRRDSGLSLSDKKGRNNEVPISGIHSMFIMWVVRIELIG